MHNAKRIWLFLTTTLGGWLATAFAHAVFDGLATGFTWCAPACLTHIITSSLPLFYHRFIFISTAGYR